MDNKFVRYCIVEPKCRLRIAILLLFVAVIVGQTWYRGAQIKKVSALQVKGVLIARIAAMEKELRTKERLEAFRSVKDNEPNNVHFAKINGVAMNGRKPSVLIDEAVYAEGDSYGEYVVVTITQEMITLVNKKTNARKNLYVFE